VSLDEGEFIILPSGKRMRPTEAWEEAPLELREKLTPVQEAAVKEFLDCPPMTPMEAAAWRLHKANVANRKFRPQRKFRPPEVAETAMVVVSDFED
jgi:hypothetical protein